eukprot:757947-Hanusia_phi.AAC.6
MPCTDRLRDADAKVRASMRLVSHHHSHAQRLCADQHENARRRCELKQRAIVPAEQLHPIASSATR